MKKRRGYSGAFSAALCTTALAAGALLPGCGQATTPDPIQTIATDRVVVLDRSFLPELIALCKQEQQRSTQNTPIMRPYTHQEQRTNVLPYCVISTKDSLHEQIFTLWEQHANALQYLVSKDDPLAIEAAWRVLPSLRRVDVVLYAADWLGQTLYWQDDLNHLPLLPVRDQDTLLEMFDGLPGISDWDTVKPAYLNAHPELAAYRNAKPKS